MEAKGNTLQTRMRNDIRTISESPDIIISDDKTSNLYSINPEAYLKNLRDNIKSEYTRSNPVQLENINREATDSARKLKINDKVEAIAEKQNFLTIKDHKPDFPGKTKFCLINTCKTNIGKVSKQLFDQINTVVREASKLNQWGSTEDFLYWFKNLDQKDRREFLKFDIESFYPSNTKQLL